MHKILFVILFLASTGGAFAMAKLDGSAQESRMIRDDFGRPHSARGPLRTVTATGESKLKLNPDVAVVSITAHAEDKKADKTKEKSDKLLKELNNIIKGLSISGDDVKTDYSSLQPKYRWEQETGKQIFEGYESNTNVTVKMRRMNDVALFLERLVEGGFDRINNISYELDDYRKAQDEAMLNAIENAKNKAENMVKRAGGDIGKVINISEGAGGGIVYPQPVPMMDMAVASSAEGGMARMKAAPVAPPAGAIEVTANATLTFELR